METEVKENPVGSKRGKKSVKNTEKRDEVVQEVSTSVEMDGKEKLKLGVHQLLVVISRIIEGCMRAYRDTFVVESVEVKKFQKEIGFDWFEKGEYEKAIKSLGLSLKEESAVDPEVLFYLGMAHSHIGEHDTAVEYLKKAEAVTEDDYDILAELGRCLIDAEFYGEAVDYLKRASALVPDANTVHYLMGNAYERQNKFAEAIQSYKRAVELDPRNALYYQTLGFAYESSGKHSDAIASFKKAMEIEKNR